MTKFEQIALSHSAVSGTLFGVYIGIFFKVLILDSDYSRMARIKIPKVSEQLKMI